jgi:hypothetical protein
MLNRSSIFALAAIAAVAVGALSPTSASAMRGSFGGSGGSRSFSSAGISHTASISRAGTTGISSTRSFSRGGSGRVSFLRQTGSTGVLKCAFCNSPGTPTGTPLTPSSPCTEFTRCGNPPGTYLPPPIALWPSHHHDHPWWITFHHPHWGVGEYDTTLVTAPVDTAATPTAPCNCLTKQYLDDGSVLFQDICTKEAAMATPDELKAQVQGVSPQTQAQPQTQTQ